MLYNSIKYPILTLSILCSSMLIAVDGILDTTFNPAGTPPGTVSTNVNAGPETAYAVLVQPIDQKIVLVGSVFNNSLGQPVFGLVRYNPDGSLDSSFGSGGTVTSPQFPPGGPITTASGAFAAALQSDGKIVAAGFATILGVNQFALARYNTNGTLDTSFNGTGFVTTATPGGDAEAHGVVILPDGTIVAGGFGFNAGLGDITFTLASYDTLGLLIGTVQQTVIDNSDASQINALALDPLTGFLVASGYADMNVPPVVRRFATARYSNPITGTLHTAFNPGSVPSPDTQEGVVVTAMPDDTTPTSSEAFTVTVQSDQKIIVGGSTNFFFNGAFVRYFSDGSLDGAFGPSGGRIILPFTSFAGVDSIYGLTLQTDGKIVVAGTTDSQTGIEQFFVGRYLTTGFVDPTFNPGSTITGFNFTTINGVNSEAFAVALQADQKIVLAGNVENTDEGFLSFAAARYNSLTVIPVCPLLQTPRSDIIQAIMSKYCIC